MRAPKAKIWVANPTKKFPTHAALMSSIHLKKPSRCNEAVEEQVWWDLITKEPDFCEIVPKPTVEYVIDFKRVSVDEVFLEQGK